MAYVKSPLAMMLADRGIDWRYYAVLGTDRDTNTSTYKVYLHRQHGGGWWLYEDDMPMVMHRAEAPSRYYGRTNCNIITGPATRFPHWLSCHPDRKALNAAVDALRSLSEYFGVRHG